MKVVLSRLYLPSFLLFFSICFFNCHEEIEFDTPNTLKNALFIEGKLTKGDPSFVQVKIGQVFDFATNPSLFLAEYVQIVDESENVLDLNSRIQGLFNLEIPTDHPTFQVDYGNAYKIKLQLRNGTIYESAFDTLFPVPIPTDLKKDKITVDVLEADGLRSIQELVTFNISTPLVVDNTSLKPYLLWELASVFKQTDTPTNLGRGLCRRMDLEPQTCFLSINPKENYKVLNTKDLSGTNLIDFTVFEAKNTNTSVFSEGYYLTVFQQSLSKAAFEYWAQANLLTNRNGSIFEQPSGKIITNFRNLENPKTEVYGFFFVTESSFKRIYVAPEFAGNPRRTCPSPLPPQSPVCDNCLCQSNSTLEKPEWWTE